MTGESPGVLEVRLRHPVNDRLTVWAEFETGNELVALFGPSGAGKSTLLRLIAGLTTPKTGSVVFDGQTLFDQARRLNVPIRNRRIGMIQQRPHLFPHLDVRKNVGFGLSHWTRTETRQRLHEVGALCGLERLWTRYPGTLSGGEAQRVSLARALAPRPRVLLCDEPFSALDLAARSMLGERLRLVQEVERTPVLFVTHSPSEAISLASRMILLQAGKIVANGKPLEVLAAARDRAGHSLLDNPATGLRNVLRAKVLDRTADGLATRVQVGGVTEIIVPRLDRIAGDEVLVEIRADDILLATEKFESPGLVLSARNRIQGRVDRIVHHGQEAEVIVRTGDQPWIVSVVEPAVKALGLAPGREVLLIIKARSCHVLDQEASETQVDGQEDARS